MPDGEPKYCERQLRAPPGKREEARDLQLKLLNIDKVLVQKWGAAAVKGSMRLRGIPAGYPRRPLLPLKPEALEETKDKLAEHGLLD